MTNQKIVIACVITAVIAGGVGYVGGVKISSLKRASMFGNRSGQAMTMRNGNGDNTQKGKTIGNTPNMMGRGGATTGEVTAKDDKSMTVKMSDGSSKIIILSEKTVYRISEESSVSNVSEGTKVAVFGEIGNDGSVTATTIEINPALTGQTIKQ